MAEQQVPLPERVALEAVYKLELEVLPVVDYI
jgi:hypothetical protein